MSDRAQNVKRFVDAIVDLAIKDAEAGMAERAPRNSGRMLRTRMNFDRDRVCSRYGDMQQARAIYTAARFLYRTEGPTNKE